MAVTQMMDDLANGPSTIAIGRVQLDFMQSVHGLPELRRKLANGIDLLGAHSS
jgi:hypothetical protein